MEYFSDATLLCVVVVNIAIIIASCVMNSGSAKHHKRIRIMATVTMLLMSLIFDAASMAYFAMNNMAENGKVFVLFLPLIGMILYVSITDAQAMLEQK